MNKEFLENAIVVPTSTSTSSTSSTSSTEVEDKEEATVPIKNITPITEKDVKVSTHPQFETIFEDFLIFCAETFKYKMNNYLQLESVDGSNIIKNYLNNYVKLFKGTRKSPKHVMQIQEIWKVCQKHLKLDDEGDVDVASFAEWLHE